MGTAKSMGTFVVDILCIVCGGDPLGAGEHARRRARTSSVSSCILYYAEIRSMKRRRFIHNRKLFNRF